MRGFVYRFQVALDGAQKAEGAALHQLSTAMRAEAEFEQRAVILRSEAERRFRESRPIVGASAMQYAEGARRVELAEAAVAAAAEAVTKAARATAAAREAVADARRKREAFERHRARALERRAFEEELRASSELDEANRGRSPS